MPINHRREHRTSCGETCSISWKDEAGLTHSVEAKCLNVSAAGVGIECPVGLERHTTVYIQAQGGYPTGYATVRHSARHGANFFIGLELDEATKVAPPSTEMGEATDYYEFLQISRNAQPETIQRVYRFLASRYHPDNPETGDPPKFRFLNEAYEVLSEPARRLRYDAASKHREPHAVFDSVDFLDGIEGERNRRLAVLSLLYKSCRANVHSPHVSLLELEAQMAFPRDYLDFAIWYLRSKKYVRQEDNAQLSLTVLGVDYIEENYLKQPLLRKLLNGYFHSAESGGDGAADHVPDPISETHALGSGDPVPEQIDEQ